MKNLRLLSILSIVSVMTLQARELPPIWGDISHSSLQFDTRTVAYLPPVRILETHIPEGAVAENLDALLLSGNGQADLYDGGICSLKSGESESVSFILDFGKQLQGGIQVVTGRSKTRGAKLRLCFGESVAEAMSVIDGKNGATNDHAMRDLVIELPWLGVTEIGNSGFRFVKVEVLGANTEVNIKEIRAKFAYRDIPYRGSFECDDERLNDIWMTGAYTVHLNMQEYLWDGIKRDRLVWVGDLHPEVMTVNNVFGYNEVVPKSLDLIRDKTPIPEWMNGISSYSIWWLLIQKDWYLYHGDESYLKEQRGYLIDLVKHLMSRIDEDGREVLDGSRFLDWPSSENEEGVHAGLQALMAMAMDAGEQLLTQLDEPRLAKECRAAAAKLRKFPTPDHNHSKQGAALMALAGIMDAKAANDDVLSVGGAKNFSTFYGYYMLEAMAKAGNYSQAMDVISEYWGAMLDLGATSFWEDFDIDWLENAARIDEPVPAGKVDVHSAYGKYCYVGLRHSFCHGWASGPTSWLTQNVLGVQVVEAGCKKVRIKPYLGDLKWVKGSFPTPMGDIHIEHKREPNGKITTTVDAPEGVKIVK